MRIPERVGCSRFPAGSGALSSLARARGVAHRATATGGATKLAITIWIFAVAVRLILINQPYIDHWSWRQCDVAATCEAIFDLKKAQAAPANAAVMGTRGS